MIFELKRRNFNRPYPAFGRPASRDMPIIPLTVHCGGATVAERAFVDSMADFVTLPDWVAPRVGIDLSVAPSHTITVIGGSQVVVKFARVTLEIPHPRGVRWSTDVAFGPTPRWLFGHFGGLEFFHFTLDAVNEELFLEPRENLPVA